MNITFATTAIALLIGTVIILTSRWKGIKMERKVEAVEALDHWKI
jgi:hypothetical protein